MSSKLLDTEPGGESSQYESIRTVTGSPRKEKGQLGVNEKNTISEMKVFPEKNADNNAEVDQESASDQGLGGEIAKGSG